LLKHGGTGSFAGWAVSLSLGAVAALKLSRALSGVKAAMAGEALAGAAGGGMGMLARLGSTARGARTGIALTRDAMATRGAITGIVEGLSLIPPSLGIAAAGMAAVAGAALLWKQHMDGVHDRAQRVAADMQRVKALAAVPGRQADLFGGLANSVEGIERAGIAMRDIRRQIAQTRADLRGATGTRRSALLDQLRSQELDLADATLVWSRANQTSNRAFNAFNASLQAHARNLQAIRDVRERLRQLQRIQQIQDLQTQDRLPAGTSRRQLADEEMRLRTLTQTHGRDISQAIADAQRNIAKLTPAWEASLANLRNRFTSNVRALSRMKILPKVDTGAISDMFRLALRKGRALTIPEMRAVIRAEVSRASLNKARADIRRVVSEGVTIRGAVKLGNLAAQMAPFQRIAGMKIATTLTPPKNAGAVHSKIANVFKKTIHQNIRINTPTPPAESVGAGIAQGIANGIIGNMGAITSAAVAAVGAALGAARAAALMGSPSRLFAEKVGKPLVQGIAVGVLENAHYLERAAAITMDLFQGAIVSNLKEKQKPTAAILTKDLQSQLASYRKFNNALTNLRRRGAPKELLDQLAALGPEAADKIALLARMSGPQLKKYVALWKAANNEVKKSVRATQKDIADAMKQMTDDAVSKIMDTYNQFRDVNQSNFGALFEGPSNLADMTGDNFKQAMDSYNQQIGDFQSQLKDLNQQLVDNQKEAQQRLIDAIQARRDELISTMGGLFGGDWLQGPEVQTKIDWGQKLGFTDLEKDLESQVSKFKRWRDDLVSLAAKVPPDLAKQLEALGPDAVDKLDVLNNATDDQLKQYVTTWQQGQDAINQVAQKTTVDTSDITARTADILKQIDAVTKQMAELKMPHELTSQDIIDDLQGQMDQWDKYQGLLSDLIAKGLPDELIQQLQQMGPKAIPYLEAINNMTAPQLAKYEELWNKSQKSVTDATVKMLNTQLKLWFQYGKNIALNIIAGVSAEQQRLENYFREVITDILKGMALPGPLQAPTNNDDPAPYEVSTGSNVDYGTNPGDTQTRSQGSGLQGMRVQIGPIIAHQDESLQTTLERAAFRLNTTIQSPP
jgi:hypothetical protein